MGFFVVYKVFRRSYIGKISKAKATKPYRFLGVIEIPTDDTYQPLKVDTRQGVAVEYVPNAAIA